ncbi:MAG: glycosyltransferase [Methanospirillaceae archaeon]|nr:glycosyltransferase [Methanospirillaceae archaeon]
MSTIAAAMIVRNGGDTLESCLASICDYVDEIVIGIDDRTTDDTDTIAKRYNAFTFPFTWRDDFAYARNLVAERVTSEWILVVDADDCLVSGGEHLIPPDGYNGGTVIVRTGHGRELPSCRIYQRGAAQYRYRVHEYPVFDNPKTTTLPVVIVHEKGEIIEPGRNLRILTGIMDDYPRYLFNYGRECITAGEFEKGISSMLLYLQLNPSETYKMDAVMNIARSYFQLENITKARRYALMALEVNQDCQPAYIFLGQIAYSRQEYIECINWLEHALRVKKIEYVFDSTMQDYQYACDILGTVYFYLKDYKSSEKYLEICLSMDPENERLQKNLGCCREKNTE